jgi:hypothetical protein
MFLSENDLRQLTGVKRPTAQVRWLRKNGYRHTVNEIGFPVVMIAEVSRKLVGGSKTSQEPNWAALDGPSKAA